MIELLTLKKLRQGKKLVFTNGVFDLFHVGHLHSLEQAKSLGDLLFVGVNSDRSVRALKGDGRPVHTLEDRVKILEALRCVDGVVRFDTLDATNLIEQLQPEIYVKGGDYNGVTFPEAEKVISYGGQVVFIPLVQGKSTTSILNR